MIRIVLDGEPRGKGRPRFVRATGRTYTPEDTRSYEDRLRWAAQIEMRNATPLREALSVRVTARCPIPKSLNKKQREAVACGQKWPVTKPDADNIAKMLDALNRIVWDDDAQIVDLRVLKVYSEKPQLEIEIWTLTELF